MMSGNLCLRQFVEDDADAFATAVRESVATVGLWMPWCHAGYTADEARQWFAICERSLAEKSAYEFGIFAADGERFLGGTGLNQLNRLNNCCNLGYWVRESCQRQGVATRTLRLLAEFGFASLGLTRIEIVVAQGNVRWRGSESWSCSRGRGA